MRENIRVDLGSNCCIDMTYTLGADIYLGDVSSQIYEFLLQPRPCVFLNAHGAQWQDDPNYLHWTCGPVLQGVAALDETLGRAADDFGRFRPIQESLFAQTIDTSDIPSSRRAALAIAEHLRH
jgi:CDP-glycerol glycerophosphotransferase (TagB/SpsB family)